MNEWRSLRQRDLRSELPVGPAASEQRPSEGSGARAVIGYSIGRLFASVIALIAIFEVRSRTVRGIWRSADPEADGSENATHSRMVRTGHFIRKKLPLLVC